MDEATVINENLSNASASNATSHTTMPDVPKASEEMQTDQHSSNDGKNKAIKRFLLPLEYYPRNTRWTLNHEDNNMPGLVELIPLSSVYVSYSGLKKCLEESDDCEILARLLLEEVFNRKALSVCLSIAEKAKGTRNKGANKRPLLDEHASTVLLEFITDHCIKCGWDINIGAILSQFQLRTEEIRHLYAEMVEVEVMDL